MDTRQLTKDVEINGQKYQIGKMDARTGSWIVMQIFTKLMPAQVEGQLGIANLPADRTSMSEQEFYNLQDHCLMVCGRYEIVGSTQTAMPIMVRPGVWAIKELEKDVLTVMALTVHALLFNAEPFFVGDALQQIVQTFKDSILANASK